MKIRLSCTTCLCLTLAAGCGDDGDSSTTDTTMGTDGATSTSTTGGETTTSEGSSTSTSTSTTDDSTTTSATSTTDDSTGSSGGGSTGLADNFFNNTIQPIFTANCGCHLPGGPAFDLMSLAPGSAYGNIVSVSSDQAPALNRVEPGNLDDSYLWNKLAGTQGAVGGRGSRMPAGGALPAAETMVIRDWIVDGAPLE